ncbi:proline-rich extensin-like protein EPR1 [Drosophila subpulchrella]|uniref:proline-rich extensin-like protein EPR1 n=1 Tax=Drosophila subpulchrella TaxID=1486046 RepID=UPI0018A16E35|nr:proline-rich extensin-like protein EPR1 [Drosophila subpulchrella]
MFCSQKNSLIVRLGMINMRVIFVAFAVALLGVVGATSLSRTYLPPQVQVVRPQVISVPRVQVQPQIIHRQVIQPQNTYLPPAPRVVPQVIPAYRPAAQVISVAAPRNTYLPPAQVISRPAPQVVSISRPVAQVISVAAPRNTYLPPQVIVPRNTYLPPQVIAPRNTYLPPQ